MGTSKEVPNMESLTKDISRRTERGRLGGKSKSSERVREEDLGDVLTTSTLIHELNRREFATITIEIKRDFLVNWVNHHLLVYPNRFSMHGSP